MSISFGWTFETDVGWDTLLSLTQELDRSSGFDHVWVTDALAGRELDGPRLDGWSALAALAQATTRLRLGVLVTCNPLRHPAVLAKMATTVDHISGGRLEFGIGSGWPGENRRFGVPFYTKRERDERLEEALQVITSLWTQEGSTFEGRHYHLDDAPFSPPNVQRPHPPITVGGSSDAVLRAAARYASAANSQVRQETFEKLDAFCLEAGREPSTLQRTDEPMLFLNDDPAFQARVIEEVMAVLRVDEEGARRAVLLGSPDDIKAQIEQRAALGVSNFVVWQFPQMHTKSLFRFSDEVIPAFK